MADLLITFDDRSLQSLYHGSCMQRLFIFKTLAACKESKGITCPDLILQTNIYIIIVYNVL